MVSLHYWPLFYILTLWTFNVIHYILNSSLNKWCLLGWLMSQSTKKNTNSKPPCAHFSVAHPATSIPAQPSSLKALIHSPDLRSRQARSVYIHPHLSNLHPYPFSFVGQTGPIRSRYDVWSLPLIMKLVHLRA